MQKLIPLSRIKPNPHRKMERYPIKREKVDALKESFRKTGFWGNVVGREVGKNVELAYGHHRLIALQEENKGEKVEVIVKDLSTDDMLHMMADENMQEWGTDSIIEQETVRAVVDAYARGVENGGIELEKPKGTQYLRYAPSFLAGDSPKSGESKPYTSYTVAKFLGWTKKKGKEANERVTNALAVLETAEQMNAEKAIASITEGLGSNQARETVKRVREVRDSHKASGASDATAKKHGLQAGRAIKKDLEKGKQGQGVRGARTVADDFKPNTKTVPDLDPFAEKFLKHIGKVLREDNAHEAIEKLLKWKEYIDDNQRKRLALALAALGKRCETYAARLDGKAVGTKVHLLEN